MLAHERWFTQDELYPVEFAQALTPQLLVPAAIGLAATVALWLLARVHDRPVVPGPRELGMSDADYGRLLRWMPLVIGLHTAVPLLVAGAQRQLFVASMPLDFTIWGGLLGLAQIVIALSFVYGAGVRFAAPLLGLVFFAGMLLVGPWEPLEQSVFLGLAAFLFATGRGPLSFDMALRARHHPIPWLVEHSVTVLRVLTGVSIVFVALGEKLLNVDMGLAFLAEYPFNFLPALGLEVSDRTFILIAGTIELTFGLLLIAGNFIRLVILVLWLPFNLTLPFMGWTELVGHLPIYGVMALLLVWEPHAAFSGEVLISGIRDHEARTAAGPARERGSPRAGADLPRR